MTGSTVALPIFHPAVSDNTRAQIETSVLYRPMLEFIRKVAKHHPDAPRLQCLGGNACDARIGTPDRLHVASLSYSDKFYLSVYDHSISSVSKTVVSTGKKWQYTVNAAFRQDSAAANRLKNKLWYADINKVFKDLVMNTFRRTRMAIREEVGRSPPRLSDAISNLAVDGLLEAYASGVTEDMLTPQLREAVHKLRTTCKESTDRSAAYGTRMNTMFSNDKWLVVCLPEADGYFVGAYNARIAADIYNQHQTESMPDISMPLTYYPRLTDLPGDMHESLMAKLTMMSMIAKPKLRGADDFVDAQKLFFCEDLLVEGARFIGDHRTAYTYMTFDR